MRTFVEVAGRILLALVGGYGRCGLWKREEIKRGCWRCKFALCRKTRSWQ